ncbi:MAG TPA: cytochrome c [Vicinamibacteria bacterium]|nr:cytochrome c [Vicinamibacteria bacterium]
MAALLLGTAAVLTCGKVPSKGVGSDLTPFELAHGVGPIKEPLNLDPIDEQLAAAGQKLYQMNCGSCHRLDRRFVGPPLGAVTARRSPEFVLNMILAPQAMLQKHPEARKLLEQYLTPMTPANVSREEARAVLEYLRTTPPPVQ